MCVQTVFIIYSQYIQINTRTHVCVCTASWLNMRTCIFYSEDLGCCIQWLFAFLLSYCGLQSVCPFWPLTRAIIKKLFSTQLPLTRHFLFSGPFSVNSRNVCGVVKIPTDQKVVKHSDQPVQSHLNALSSPSWGSLWTSASCIHHACMPKCTVLLLCELTD